MEVEKGMKMKPKNAADPKYEYQRNENIGGTEKFMTVLIQICSWILIVLLFPIAVPLCIRMVQVKYLRSSMFTPY